MPKRKPLADGEPVTPENYSPMVGKIKEEPAKKAPVVDEPKVEEPAVEASEADEVMTPMTATTLMARALKALADHPHTHTLDPQIAQSRVVDTIKPAVNLESWQYGDEMPEGAPKIEPGETLIKQDRGWRIDR